MGKERMTSLAFALRHLTLMNINWMPSPEGGELRMSQRINLSWPGPCVVHSWIEDVNINGCPLTEVNKGLCYHRDTGWEHTEDGTGQSRLPGGGVHCRRHE